MEQLQNNKKLKIIAGIFILILLTLVGYYFAISPSGGDNQRDDSGKTGIFGFLGGQRDSSEVEQQGQWFMGYMNKRNQAMSYSQMFLTKRECLAYEDKVAATPSLKVVVNCFQVDDGVEGPKGEDVFKTDPSIQQGPSFGGIIKSDTQPPVIQIVGGNPEEIEVGGTYVDMGATAIDEIDGDLTGQISVNGLPIVTFRPMTTTVNYRVSDNAGNVAYASRRVHVVERLSSDQNDNVVKNENQTVEEYIDRGPVIVLKGYNPIILEVGASYDDAGARAFDVEDGNVTYKIEVSGSVFDTSVAGTNYVTYSVIDYGGNRTESKRTVEIIQPKINMATDVDFITSCFGKMAHGKCAVADANGNGVVGQADLDMIYEILSPFEISGDPSIDMSTNDVITSCIFKTETGCAKDEHPNIKITRAYLDTAYDLLFASAHPDYYIAVDLAKLAQKIGDSPLDKIMYATFAQFDLNKDGIVDLNGWAEGDGIGNQDREFFDNCRIKEGVGECKRADINQDGKVLSWDKGIFNIIQSQYLPEAVTIMEIEMALFDRTMYSDGSIVRYCNVNNIAVGYCEFADFDGDGDVDDDDENLFIKKVSKYDFNGDGILDGVTISL